MQITARLALLFAFVLSKISQTNPEYMRLLFLYTSVYGLAGLKKMSSVRDCARSWESDVMLVQSTAIVLEYSFDWDGKFQQCCDGRCVKVCIEKNIPG